MWRLCVVFLEHGGGALGIFKSPVCTYNQAWTFLCPLHTIFLPEQTKGVAYTARRAKRFVCIYIYTFSMLLQQHEHELMTLPADRREPHIISILLQQHEHELMTLPADFRVINILSALSYGFAPLSYYYSCCCSFPADRRESTYSESKPARDKEDNKNFQLVD